MSNVLIGIIGVILFIGLALAGALFLGPRFQESTNNSKASAAVQAVTQVSNAFSMYRLSEGKKAATVDDLVTGGYLKTTPPNPTGISAVALNLTSGVSSTAPNGIVGMEIGGNAKAICEAIGKQTTGTASVRPDIDSFGEIGCFGDESGHYYAVAKL